MKRNRPLTQEPDPPDANPIAAHAQLPERAKWTSDEIRMLVGLWKNEAPTREIADSMGRTEKSVSAKANRLGLRSRRSWGKEQFERARSTGNVRSCLSCGREFYSAGSGNRICLKCKSGPQWHSGTDCTHNAPCSE